MMQQIDWYEDDAPLPPPSRWRKRLLWLFALIMVLVLLAAAVSPAWNLVPWMLGYWNNSYHLTLTNVSGGRCTESPHSPSREVCVCGVLEAGGGRADFTIHLRDEGGKALKSYAVKGQESGPFCRTLSLETWLKTGWYTVVVIPRLMRNEVARLDFHIQDTRPDI